MREILIQCTSCFYFKLMVTADLAYILVQTLKSICWTLPCSQRTVSSLMEYPSKIKWKLPISTFKDAYIKSYKFQLPVLLFLVVLHQQTSVLRLFRTSFITIGRKIFTTNFSCLTDSPKFPHPLTGRNC